MPIEGATGRNALVKKVREPAAVSAIASRTARASRMSIAMRSGELLP